MSFLKGQIKENIDNSIDDSMCVITDEIEDIYFSIKALLVSYCRDIDKSCKREIEHHLDRLKDLSEALK